MCFGLQGPVSGERRHSRAPRGAHFEHLSNTSSTQVLDCSNTSSCQSNSHPYPGNPGLTLDTNPCALPGGPRHKDLRSRRDFSNFALHPGEPPAFAALPRRCNHVTFLRSGRKPPTLAALGPPTERGPFCGAPPAARPDFADLARICSGRTALL